MELNIDSNWLRQMAEKEDGRIVSVGGLAMKMEEQLIHDCILFAYSHGQITEGAAANLLKVDRLEFRDRWLNWLQHKTLTSPKQQDGIHTYKRSNHAT